MSTDNVFAAAPQIVTPPTADPPLFVHPTQKQPKIVAQATTPQKSPNPAPAPTEKPNIQGNIDINFRPVVHNADAQGRPQVQTLYSASFHDDRTGKEVLVPQVLFIDSKGNLITASQAKQLYAQTGMKPQGKVVDGNTAWQFYLKTGENLGSYDTPAQATAASIKFHEINAADPTMGGQR